MRKFRYAAHRAVTQPGVSLNSLQRAVCTLADNLYSDMAMPASTRTTAISTTIDLAAITSLLPSPTTEQTLPDEPSYVDCLSAITASLDDLSQTDADKVILNLARNDLQSLSHALWTYSA